MFHYREILRMAESRGTCIATIDCGWGHLEFLEAVLNTAKKHNAPAAILCWGGFVKAIGFAAYTNLVDAMATRLGVPATLHLDHSHDPDEIKAAIDGGFTSVMYDVEDYEFEEAISRAKALVEYAHSKGAIVESSFSSIGREHGGGAADRPEEVTDPAQAARFVEETGVDIFSPAVGNLHGCVDMTMPLDWNVIEAISGAVDVPLALHGGSGVAIKDVARAAGCGFRKLNLYTKLQHVYSAAVRAHLAKRPDDPWTKWAAAGRAALEAAVEPYFTGLNLVGSAADLDI